MSSKKFNMLIFSDLDGTILSTVDYDPGPSLSAIQFAVSQGIELFIVSSKTRTEIEFLRQQYDWNFGFIVENGGAVYLPASKYARPDSPGFVKDGVYYKLDFGTDFGAMCSFLDEIAETLQIKMTAFHRLSAEQIAKTTGLSIERSKLAGQREYDEPFIIHEQSLDKIPLLVEEIKTRGFHYTRGGRYHHITTNCDKGRAVMRVIQLLKGKNKSLQTAAIGDAANDLPMFQQVDYPFLVRKTDGSYAPDAVLPDITITDGIGPHGFSEAIRILVEKNSNST